MAEYLKSEDVIIVVTLSYKCENESDTFDIKTGKASHAYTVVSVE